MKNTKLTSYLLVLALGSFAVACGKDGGSSGGSKSNSSNINVGELPVASSLSQIKNQINGRALNYGLSAGKKFYFVDISVNQHSIDLGLFDLPYSTSSTQCEFNQVMSASSSQLHLFSGNDNCSDTTPSVSPMQWTIAGDADLSEFMAIDAGQVSSVRAAKVNYDGSLRTAYMVEVLVAYNHKVQYIVSPNLSPALNPVARRDLSTGEYKYLYGASIQLQ